MQLFSLAILSVAGFAVAFAQQPSRTSGSADRVDKIRSISPEEVKFVQDSLNVGRREVDIARLALKNGSSAETRAFAQHVIDDHTTANLRLELIAREYAIHIPEYFPSPSSPAYKSGQERTSMNWSGIDPKTNMGVGRTADRLAILRGPSFDRAFAQQMVQDHEADVTRFQEAQKTVTNVDLKDFINRTLPTRQDHLAEARALK